MERPSSPLHRMDGPDDSEQDALGLGAPAIEVPPFDLEKERRAPRTPKTIHLWILLGLGLIAGFALLIQAYFTHPHQEDRPTHLSAGPAGDAPPPLAPLEQALVPPSSKQGLETSPQSVRDLLKNAPGQLPRGHAGVPEDLRRYELDRADTLIAGSKILALNHASSNAIVDSVGSVMTAITKTIPAVEEGLRASRPATPPLPKPEEHLPALHPTLHAPGPLLLEGSSIPCVLLSEVRSDLPGMVVAQVSDDIYDSERGAIKLIPRGARLIGRYDTKLAQGQLRLMASFHRLILPNGQSVLLNKMDSADLGGGAGLEGDVDTHFWARFGQAFLIAGLAKSTEPTNNNTAPSGAASIIGPNAAGQILVETARMNLQANGLIQPTMTIHRGEPFLVMVNHDLALPEIKDAP